MLTDHKPLKLKTKKKIQQKQNKNDLCSLTHILWNWKEKITPFFVILGLKKK